MFASVCACAAVTETAERPATAALLGAGVIGAGWAARLLLAGVDVRLFDPAPDAVRLTFSAFERARTAWHRLTPAPLGPEGSLSVHPSITEAVVGAELVQESAPERESLKRSLLAEASRAAAPDTIIASSTSGLRPSRLCLDMARPERVVLAHPFNPVYLLPLAEVCGSSQSSQASITRAAAMYRSLGMQPLVV